MRSSAYLAAAVATIAGVAVSGAAPARELAPLPAGVTLPDGFSGGVVAHVPKARELAALPNGDLLVGTSSSTVYLVPRAEAGGAASKPVAFIRLPDPHADGVAYADGFIYVGTEHGVWRVPYRSGEKQVPASRAVEIARVRTGPIAPHSDGDVHRTTSVAVAGSKLFVSVGSSCNACTEVDPTRAVILEMDLDGTHLRTIARRVRNAIALTVNPATGTLWAGDAGQDDLPPGHPYEWVDAVTRHAAPADYGWPECEENRVAYAPGADCSGTVIPSLEFPAYSTPIGAVFYPLDQRGAYAFPRQMRGLYVADHGSWHAHPSVPPQVAFVPMNGDAPRTPVDWSDPTKQWTTFMGGMGTRSSTHYRARPTGIAVGAQGSLFVADDHGDAVYRIRPSR